MSDSPKKIFLIIAALAPGGAERVMSQLAGEFANYPNTQVHLVLLAQQEDFYDIDSRVIIHRLGFQNKGNFKKILAVKGTFIKLRSLLKKEDPDTVLSFLIKYNILTLLAAKGLGLRVFVSERNNPYRNYGKKLMFLERLTYRKAAGIIAQTELAKQVLAQRTGNKNVKVIPNPVKQIKLYPEIQREKIILNIGSLSSQKGHKYLIEAFSMLNMSDWKLVILGEGDERLALENQIKELQLENHVFLPGVKEDIDPHLAQASIFAFSSLFEGFPNGLVEAMAAGLACVSFDCNTGPRDVIRQNENGILVNEKDVVGLTVALKRLIKDESLREYLGENALQIGEHLSVQKVAKQYFEFIT